MLNTKEFPKELYVSGKAILYRTNCPELSDPMPLKKYDEEAVKYLILRTFFRKEVVDNVIGKLRPTDYDVRFDGIYAFSNEDDEEYKVCSGYINPAGVFALEVYSQRRDSFETYYL